ncbi:hypothetical protein VTI74DRAFT_3673 [Chaetomium olivicolor]
MKETSDIVKRHRRVNVRFLGGGLASSVPGLLVRNTQGLMVLFQESGRRDAKIKFFKSSGGGCCVNSTSAGGVRLFWPIREPSGQSREAKGQACCGQHFKLRRPGMASPHNAALMLAA